MKHLTLFRSARRPETPERRQARERRSIQREWDRQRARAITPSERDEIDAIFSRAL